jgi:hypothetical protein
MPGRRSLPVVGGAVSFLLGALAGPAAAQQRAEGVVGYVLSVRGDWVIGRGAEPAASGRALLTGDTIRAGRTPTDGREIVLVLRDGGAVRYRCADAPSARPTPGSWNCAQPIGVKPQARSPVHARVLDAVMNHFRKHASRPASLVSRSILDPDLREAVAVLREGGPDLRDALSALPAGDYELTVTAIQVDGAVVRRIGAPATARLTWDPRTPRTLESPGIQPGLHELGMVGGSDVAWVLVCAGAGCDSVRGRFQEVRELASLWAGQVSAPDARAFLRAALDLFARQGSGS